MSKVFQVLTIISGGLGVIAAIFSGVNGGIGAVILSLLSTAVGCFCLYAVGRLFENQEAALELLTMIRNDMKKQSAQGLPSQDVPGTPAAVSKSYGAVPANHRRPADATEPWTCRKCGRVNEPQYKACTNCRTPR